MTIRATAAACIAAMIPLAPALAQVRAVGPGVADRAMTITRGSDEDSWVLGGEIQASLQMDALAQRNPSNANGNLYTDSLITSYLLMPYGFALNGTIRMEQTGRDLEGRGSVFNNQTLYLEELNLTWTHGVLDLFGGKFHPRFGSAWDRGPGLYGTDIGEDYELTQKVGVGARLWLSDLLGITRLIGSHNLQAEFFTADRSAMSYGLISPQWQQVVQNEDGVSSTGGTRWRFRNRRFSGGADNTSFLGGTVVSLAGGGIPMPVGQSGYLVSYSNRRAGEDAVVDQAARAETGWTAGGYWTVPLPQRMEFVPYVEYASLDNAGGYRGDTSTYWTAGFDLRRAPWTVSYAYMQNAWTNAQQQTGATLVEQTASLTYDLYFIAPTPWLRPLSVTVGYRHMREQGVVTNGYGGLVAWSWKS